MTNEELHAWLGLVFKNVIGSKIHPGIGTAAAAIARTMAELGRSVDLDRRIADLERERDARRPA